MHRLFRIGGGDLEPDDHGFPQRLFFSSPAIRSGAIRRLDRTALAVPPGHRLLDTADRQRALAFRAA